MPLLAINKKAYHDYEILETSEAGIILTGPEVKAVKLGQVSLTGGYSTIDKNNEVWLNNIHIAPYKPASGIQIDYNPLRSRKLLLKKKEISSLIGKINIKGYTLVPLKIYTKNKFTPLEISHFKRLPPHRKQRGSLTGFIKVEIGLCRGKKKWDKKEEIKKREIKKRIREVLK